MEKLLPKETFEGAHTVLRGSVRAPKGFSEGKPEAAKLRGGSSCVELTCPPNMECELLSVKCV